MIMNEEYKKIKHKEKDEVKTTYNTVHYKLLT